MSERQEKIDFLYKQVKDKSSYLENNEHKLEIYEGKLMDFVLEIMSKTLSRNYFERIKSRVIPINVLTRVMDKMSKVYINEPDRRSDLSQDWVDKVEKTTDINMIMSLCDTYANLFKGYLVQPYVYNREIKLRPIEFDKFLPIAEDKANPEKMTGLILCMGEIKDSKGNRVKKYYYYSDNEFIPFMTGASEKAMVYEPDLEGNDGVNPYGFIPYVYGNRSITKVLPKQDTDIAQIAKVLPVILSDISGAVMFQCFSVVYGVDVKADNLTMSPNAFWSLKSDKNSDTSPSVGTIKPEVDSDKVRNLVKDIFSLWLETKGVRVGNIGSMDGSNFASGISKIIDEMDVFEIKKQSIGFFKKEEKELWQKLVSMNNDWVKQDEIDNEIISEDTQVETIFDDPRPETPRSEEVETKKKEVESGFLDRETAIRELYPDLSDEQVKERLEKIKAERSEMASFAMPGQGNFNGVDKREN